MFLGGHHPPEVAWLCPTRVSQAYQTAVRVVVPENKDEAGGHFPKSL